MRFSRQYAMVLVFAIGLGFIGFTAWADSQGPNFASTLGNQQEWVKDSNALGANDNVCATTSIGFADIDVTGFGFSIPPGAAITGIRVELKVARTNSANFSAQLLKAGITSGAGKTFARPNAGATSCSTSDFVSLGGDGDLWGTTWTPDQINAGRFGVRIDSGGIDTATRFLDAVRVTVYYTLPTAGTIVIVKDAVPDDPQDFGFSRSFGADFLLDDDSDGTLPNTITFTGVAVGTYTVTELGPPAGWALTDLVCDDPDDESTVNVGTRTVTIDLDAGETVTCTFTNTKSDIVDLVVEKTDDIDPVLINELVTYTITVTNNGPSDAPNVIVTDTLPASGVTFVSATTSQGGPCTKAGNVVTCPLGTIANGNDATVTIQVRYTATGTKTNTASASSALPDSDTSNNTHGETTTVTQLPQPCPGVTFTTTTPSSITFAYVGQRRRVTVRVENRSGAAIQVTEFEPQPDEPFTVFRVIPSLPRTVANNEVRRFYLIVKGTALETATVPYFYIHTSCGVVTTASEPQLLVPLQLEHVQVEERTGHLRLEAQGTGIESVQLQLFDLSGRTVIDQVNHGTSLTVSLANSKGSRLAKGVYLYIVTLYGRDGTVWRSEVRKLIVR